MSDDTTRPEDDFTTGLRRSSERRARAPVDVALTGLNGACRGAAACGVVLCIRVYVVVRYATVFRFLYLLYPSELYPLYRSEIYYRSPIDGTHWLPNKEMTTLWEASVTIHIPSSPARAGTIRDRAERPTPHEARKASAS